MELARVILSITENIEFTTFFNKVVLSLLVIVVYVQIKFEKSAMHYHTMTVELLSRSVSCTVNCLMTGTFSFLLFSHLLLR